MRHLALGVGVLLMLTSGCQFSSGRSVGRADYQVLYGSIHAHTDLSDGIGTPEEAIVYARDVSRLDFFVLSDHDYMMDAAKFTAVRDLAQRYSTRQYVVIPGFEWSSLAFGHVLVLGSTEHTDSRQISTLRDLAAFARRQRAVLVLAHPGLIGEAETVFRFPETSDVINGIEIGSGYDFEGYSYRRFDLNVLESLRRGWLLGAVEGQDNHHGAWGNAPNGGWVGVVAREVHPDTILDALRHRHVFATEDRRLKLLVWGNGYLMGSKLPAARSVKFRIELSHPELAAAQVTLYEDSYELPLAVLRPSSATHVAEVTHRPDGHSHHYFVRVDLANGKHAWSSPIYLRAAQDLRVVGAWADPPRPIAGERAALKGKIFNAGAVDARALIYRFYNVSTSQVVAEGVTDVPAGEAREVVAEFTPPPLTSGSFRFAIAAPSGDYRGDNVTDLQVVYCSQTQPFQAPILVTRQFGKSELLRTTVMVRGCPRALEVLAIRASIEYVAGLLYGINGTGSPKENTDQKLYWCFAVNNVKASEGLGTYRVRAGDALSFDLHSWETEEPQKPDCLSAKP